jgi:hypothetical protein
MDRQFKWQRDTQERVKLFAARRKAMEARWPEGFTHCPQCGNPVERLPVVGAFKCVPCDKITDCFDGMVGQRLRTPIEKIARAMEIVRKYGADTSAKMLAEDIGVSLPTAYTILLRIRAAPEFDIPAFAFERSKEQRAPGAGRPRTIIDRKTLDQKLQRLEQEVDKIVAVGASPRNTALVIIKSIRKMVNGGENHVSS